MTGEEQAHRPEAPPVDPDNAVKLRADPPRVMRLSRKAIGIASASGFALVGGALIYALQPAGQKGAAVLYNTDGVAVADNLAGAPKDYDQVPKLGAALPGDLGKPILEAQRRGDVAALPPIGAQPPAAPPNPATNAADAARERAEQEREAARGSRLFFGGGSPTNAGTGFAELPAAPAGIPETPPVAGAQSEAGRKQAFLERAADRRTVSAERLSGLASTHTLWDLDCNVSAIDDLATATASADVVSCATLSSEPLIKADWVKPGTHLDLVGSFTPQMQEADPALFPNARLVIDTVTALKESGDLIDPLNRGWIVEPAIELAQVVRGNSLGRVHDDQVTIFKSVGTGLADIAAARYFVSKSNTAAENHGDALRLSGSLT